MLGRVRVETLRALRSQREDNHLPFLCDLRALCVSKTNRLKCSVRGYDLPCRVVLEPALRIFDGTYRECEEVETLRALRSQREGNHLHFLCVLRNLCVSKTNRLKRAVRGYDLPCRVVLESAHRVFAGTYRECEEVETQRTLRSQREDNHLPFLCDLRALCVSKTNRLKRTA